MFLQGDHRTDGDNSLDAKLFHGVNVGAIIYFGRQKSMSPRVSSQKCDALAVDSADNEGIGRVSERSLHAQLARIFKTRHAVETAAADNSDAHRFRAAGSFLGLRFSHE